MDKKILGGIFILTSGILYSSMYISASIYGSGDGPKSKDLFKTYLGYTSDGLIIPIIITLIIGVGFIIYSELKKNKV